MAAETTQARRALVIDGTPFTRQLAGQMLKRMGFAADLFAQAEQALAAARLADYAIILLDHEAGTGAPRDLLRRMRQAAQASGARAPLILLLGPASRETVFNAYAEGAAAVIAKPFSFQTLEERVRQALGPAGARRPLAAE